jgi:hypothetical protein
MTLEVYTMAISTCTKCGGFSFEMVQATPRGSAFILTFIQCSSCGGVVGVMDALNIGAELQLIKKKLGIS